ncbi:unnamed protein product [Eruca vesicaria subsp. sativa]|uniref:Protein arginine methyltransferase NDUFAF7 n=1 Tax=Eruca vesicaria subsp. sativa TaxID=29727 RepID=A0ABC8LPV7_ERUVS|nr:unnamed protein product [Eruca vesicaria subsp. sativa]
MDDVSCSADKTVKFWDLETFELIASGGTEKIQHKNLKCTDESTSEKKVVSSIAGTPVHWHTTLEEVPTRDTHVSLHVLGKTLNKAKVNVIMRLCLVLMVLSPQPTHAALYLVKRCTWATPEEREKLEHVKISPKSMDLTQEIAKRICYFGGGALIIVYRMDGMISDSLQVCFVNILDDSGSADLSAYVYFPSIKHSAEEASENVTVHGPITQSQLFGSLGINFRVDALLKNCDDEQAESLRSGY